MAVMLFAASTFAASSVNRVIAGNYIGVNSTNPETTRVLPRTIVLDPLTLFKLKQVFNDGNNTMASEAYLLGHVIDAVSFGFHIVCVVCPEI